MARSFNGSSDLIDLGTHSLIYNLGAAGQTNGTFSGWINGSAFTNAYSAVIACFSANFEFFVKSTGKTAFYVGGVGVFDPGTTTLSTSTWYNIVFTLAAAGGAVAYINGVSEGSNAGLSGGSAKDCNIGNDPETSGRNWSGSIADVAFWNVSLSAAEITALAKGARPHTIRPLSLVAFLPLDGLQSPEPDLSGNVLNGTLTGTAKASGPPVMQFTPRWPQKLADIPAAAPSVIELQNFNAFMGRRVAVIGY